MPIDAPEKPVEAYPKKWKIVDIHIVDDNENQSCIYVVAYGYIQDDGRFIMLEKKEVECKGDKYLRLVTSQFQGLSAGAYVRDVSYAFLISEGDIVPA